MGGDWAQLPKDLLIEIGKRIKFVEDLISFSGVCSSWKVVSSLVKSKYTPAVPWLLIPESSVHRSSSNFFVFNPSTNKHCVVKLPETFGRNCWYCRDGWIFTIGFDMEIFLYNPLTGVQIGLPCADTLPMMDDDNEDSDDSNETELALVEIDSRDYHSCDEKELAMMEVDYVDYDGRNEKELARWTLIQSVLLVKIPPDNGFLVLVTSDLYHLAFAKPGDSAWSVVDYDNGHFDVHTDVKDTSVEDMIAFNGHILLLFGDGKLIGSSINRILLSEGEGFTAEEHVHGDIRGPISRFVEGSPEYFYLVESAGDLLVVVRYTESIEITDCPQLLEESLQVIYFKTKKFEVFKYNPRAPDWVGVNDLGDISLFVGSHSALSVRSSEANCKPNCIYFTDKKPDPTKSKFTGYDMGIFDLKASEVEPLDYQDDIVPRYSSPFWYMPTFV